MVFHPQALQLWPVAHFFLHGEFLEGVPSQVVPGHTPESECERAGGEDGSNEGVLHRHGMIPVFTPSELSPLPWLMSLARASMGNNGDGLGWVY